MRHLGIAIVAAGLLLAPAAAAAPAANIFENVGTFDDYPFRLDPSVRSQGMGGASAAVLWGSGNDWANPALLGYADGVRYDDEDTAYPSDLHFRARRAVIGFGGLGVALSGRPLEGLGGADLDWDSPLEFGVDSTTFTLFPAGTFARVRSWGAGASLSRAWRMTQWLHHGGVPALLWNFDVAAGVRGKHIEYPAFPGMEASATDWGVLSRARDAFAFAGMDARADLAYAYSVRNTGNRRFGLPASTTRRHGVAARVAIDVPHAWRAALPAWLGPSMPTALSLGGAWDREFVAFGERPPTDDATHLGGEVGIADVLFLRVGRADSRHTTGWGIAIPIGDWVAVRYDHARLAPMNGFDATTSRAWSVWLEPLRIVGWRR